MILRKPYGFLIKHFKLIHLILTAIYIYLAIKVNDILRYYNEFIKGTESKLNAIKYVNNYYLIAIIASTIICLIIYALMRYKKKPKLLYVILISLYLAVTILINYSYGGLQAIYISTLSARDLRLYRDLLRIIIVFQYISIFFTLIRGLGFDIKKFNFKEDISELNLDVTDDEEIELTVGNTEGLKRRIRRQLRELKYYYQENKLFISTIIGIIIVITIFILTINKKVINKEYKEGDKITTDKFSFVVLNSYLTNKSYDGSIITNSDTTFLIAKITIISKVGKTELNTSNMILKTSSGSYTINKRYTSFFKDIGTGYKDQIISNQKTYLFIYAIDKNDINKKIQINYASDKKINLSPINIDESSKPSFYKLGENIDLSQTILGSGNFNINKYNINNIFAYSYEYEINGKKYNSKINLISQNKTILYLDLNYLSDRNISIYDFISNYGKIKYKINDIEYSTSPPVNKTPNSAKNSLYLEVDKQIEKASNIWIELTIRNNKYIYTLK